MRIANQLLHPVLVKTPHVDLHHDLVLCPLVTPGVPKDVPFSGCKIVCAGVEEGAGGSRPFDASLHHIKAELVLCFVGWEPPFVTREQVAVVGPHRPVDVSEGLSVEVARPPSRDTGHRLCGPWLGVCAAGPRCRPGGRWLGACAAGLLWIPGGRWLGACAAGP